LEELLYDIRSLQELQTVAEKNGGRFGNRLSTYEAINYYVVGFATCLEWHARSRVADVLNYMPALIETADVRTIDKAVLSQMSAEKVTLPYILGAATSVSSAHEYGSIFTRIFEGLGLLDLKAEKLLREQVAAEPKWRLPRQPPLTIFQALEELFETRNALVHEIGPNQMAHFSLREMWDLDEATRVGEIALEAIRIIEGVISC
jgi:hypothetical protein